MAGRTEGELPDSDESGDEQDGFTAEINKKSYVSEGNSVNARMAPRDHSDDENDQGLDFQTSSGYSEHATNVDSGQQQDSLGESASKTAKVEMVSYTLSASVDDMEEVGHGCASKRLMHQVHSFLQDPEVIDLRSSLQYAETNAGGAKNKEYVFIPLNANARSPITGRRNIKFLRSSESGIIVYDSDIVIYEGTNLQDIVKLLHQLKDTCCESQFYEDEVNLDQCSSASEKVEDNDLQTEKDELTQTQFVTSEMSHSLSEKLSETVETERSSETINVDRLENSEEKMKEDIKQLLILLETIVDKRRFSSALELEKYLELNQKLKIAIDEDGCLQKLEKIEREAKVTNSDASDSYVNNKSLKDAISALRAKLVHNLEQLSGKLVLWQDFHEDRAELKRYLTTERQLMDSIKNRISCSDSIETIAEAEHDLMLIEQNQEEYDDKLRNMRKNNQQLVAVLDDDEQKYIRSETGILTAEFQANRDSCLQLKKKESTETYSETEEKDEDDLPSKLTFGVLLLLLLKLLLLLILFLLFYFLIFSVPPLNRFRLPVPFHLRHVGTYPPA